MKIKVIGKQHREGTSKKGNKYNASIVYPVSVLYDFTDRVLNMEEQEPILRWNAVSLQGVVVIPAGQYDLRDSVAAEPFSTIYSVYLVLIHAVLVFGLVELCRKKYEKIISGGEQS